MKISLVDDWKQAWKWISVWCMAIAAALQGAWAFLPDTMLQSIPSSVASFVGIAVLVLGIIGRLVKQGDNAD